MSSLLRVPKLEQCDRGTVFAALLRCSELGIEPDGRRAHLIPFENRKKGIVECQLIIDYKGLVELVLRSGLVSRIHADIVCENDQFSYNMGRVEHHKIDFRNPRGAAYAVYAFCEFKDGSTAATAMTLDEVNQIRARSRSASNGPWVTDYNEMAKKTVFRRLSKWLPISPEIQDHMHKDDDTVLDVGPKMELLMPPTPPVVQEAQTQTQRMTNQMRGKKQQQEESPPNPEIHEQEHESGETGTIHTPEPEAYDDNALEGVADEFAECKDGTDVLAVYQNRSVGLSPAQKKSLDKMRNTRIEEIGAALKEAEKPNLAVLAGMPASFDACQDITSVLACHQGWKEGTNSNLKPYIDEARDKRLAELNPPKDKSAAKPKKTDRLIESDGSEAYQQ